MKKILIVEDDQLVANIYRNKFSVEGYQVEVALDGATGLEQAQAFRPDVIILDLMLPVITGLDFLKQLRAEAAMEKVPVIVFSNTYLTNIVQDAWRAGATKCLSKANCTPKQLLGVVRSVLGGDTLPAPPAAANPAAPAQSNAPSASPVTPVNPVTATDTDDAFRADLRKTFIGDFPATLSTLRKKLQALIKADTEPARLREIDELYHNIYSLTAGAGITGLGQIARLTEALEALLKELHQKPTSINASTLRTVALGIDFLGLLLAQDFGAGESETAAPSVLVVEDEPISRRAVVYAMEKAKLNCTSLEDPVTAYELLCETKFDLIVLDVDMPGMTGFELCTRIRALPQHKNTPVIFVTGLKDFDSRANSMVSGGNDFIGKPFMFVELAVKALIHVLRGRLIPTK